MTIGSDVLITGTPLIAPSSAWQRITIESRSSGPFTCDAGSGYVAFEIIDHFIAKAHRLGVEIGESPEVEIGQAGGFIDTFKVNGREVFDATEYQLLLKLIKGPGSDQWP